MKKITIIICLLLFITTYAQEHFAGISTSKKVGILNGSINPSEFANLSSKFEIQILGTSLNFSNNKVGFSDIINGNNVEDLIFAGEEAVDFSVNNEIVGPSFAMKFLSWGFAITSKAHIRANIIDVDANLGDALTNSVLNSIIGSSVISNNNNQRINSTVWGEMGFSVAKKIFENDKSIINGGITFKLLFPGTYANIGAGQFQGTITNTLGNLKLNNASANLNIAYSGSLANNFTNSGDYLQSLFGNLNGLATDIGVDYQWKDAGSGYKFKVGAAVKNMGSMKFNDNDNVTRNYTLNINDIPGGGLDLNQFENADGIKDIEIILLNSDGQNGVDFKLMENNKDFKIKLPTVLNLYADLKIVPKVSVTGFLQQKLGDNNDNDQIASQNSFSLIPRFGISFFEVFTPLSFNEISGTIGGLGFRLGGFFVGSNSILTAVIDNSKQADFYIGARFGLL